MTGRKVIYIGLLIGIFISFSATELVMPVMQFNQNPVYHGPTGRNKVSLTINVDWGSEYIPAMLEIMDAYQIKATFFVTGKWVEKNQQLLKRIYNSGHEIGNHGYQHVHLTNLDERQLTDLIRKNENLIYQLTGYKTNLFAPPYGEMNSRIARIVSNIGYRPIMWSADTIDWQRPAPEVIVQRVNQKIDDGGIILIHPTAVTVKALSGIISTVKEKGFKFSTINNLLTSNNN